MLRYRCNAGTTRQAITALKNVRKLGRIYSVTAKRYRTMLRDGVEIANEVIVLRGERGTARFKGFCWGYSGEGPRGLIRLLQLLGLPNHEAETIAYNAPRNNAVGIDWGIKFAPDGTWAYACIHRPNVIDVSMSKVA